jgi:hypothetical protein
MAMGTGSAIAHHAVDGVMNSMGGGKEAAPAAPAPVAAPAGDACGTQNKTFMDVRKSLVVIFFYSVTDKTCATLNNFCIIGQSHSLKKVI